MSKRSSSHTIPAAPVTAGRTIHWAARYDLLVTLLSFGRAGTLRKRTAALAELTPGEAVLDAGCGTGDLTIEMRRYAGPNALIAGIDASPEMVARARQKATRLGIELDLRVEPLETLSFANQTFDVVVSSLVFHHLPPELKRQGLAEIRRVLRPGGRLLIVDFLRSPHHVSLHSALQTGLQDLPELLHEAGFFEVVWRRGPFPLLGYTQGRNPD